eukprot:gene115-biopygen37
MVKHLIHTPEGGAAGISLPVFRYVLASWCGGHTPLPAGIASAHGAMSSSQSPIAKAAIASFQRQSPRLFQRQPPAPTVRCLQVVASSRFPCVIRTVDAENYPQRKIPLSRSV